MGRISTPKYRLEEEMVGCYATPSAWRGRVSYERLAAKVAATNESMRPGGANELVARTFPGARVVAARIVRQADGLVMTSWREDGLGNRPAALARAVCELGDRMTRA